MSIVDKELERIVSRNYHRDEMYLVTKADRMKKLAIELEGHCEALAAYVESDYRGSSGKDHTGGVLTAWLKFKQERGK